MSSHGITIRGRGFGGAGSGSTSSSVPATTIDTSSPQYQAAYGICKALLPTRGGLDHLDRRGLNRSGPAADPHESRAGTVPSRGLPE